MRLRLEIEAKCRNNILSTQAQNDSSLIGLVSLHLNSQFCEEAVAIFLAQCRPKSTRIYDADKHVLPRSGASWQYQWILPIASCLQVRRRATAVRRRHDAKAAWMSVCTCARVTSKSLLPTCRLLSTCLPAVCSRRCVPICSLLSTVRLALLAPPLTWITRSFSLHPPPSPLLLLLLLL